MRSIVREKNNCDDIALNYIVNYFFPEFVSEFIQGDLKMKSFKNRQSTSSEHYKYRN